MTTEKTEENERKFAARIWMKLPESVRKYMAEWLVIAYHEIMCHKLRDGGYCPRNKGNWDNL
mgnify:CR=1 FL=1